MSVVTLADVKALFNPNNPYWDIAVQYLIDSGLYSGALISGAASGDIPLVSGGIRTYTNGGVGGTTKPGVALDVIVASLTSAMGGTLDKLSVSASMPDGATQIGFYDSTAYSWLNSGSVHSAIVDLANKINAIVITSGGGGGTGTVTSVDMSVPDIMSVTGNPITDSGTLAVTLNNQASNLVLAGPSTGAATTPTFRSLVDADIPSGIAATKIGSGVVSNTEFGYLDGTSAAIQTQFNILTTNLSTSSSTLQNQITNTSNNLSAYLPLTGGTLTGDLVGTTLSATTLSATNLYVPAKPVGVVYSGPISGSDAIPTFRLLSASDIPSGIDATKIGSGSVSNTEFGYLDGTSASIQTQINTVSTNLSTSSTNLQNQINVISSAGGMGSVTSVAMTVPSILAVAGSPITTSGTLAVTLANQTSGSIFAGPVSGANTLPTFRSLSASDIPSGIDATKIGSGTVSNTEFGYIDGVSAAIQTQLNTITSFGTSLQGQFANFLPLSGGTLSGQLNGANISATNTVLTNISSTNVSAINLSATNITILATVPPSYMLSGPISGSNASPTFRLLSASDLPSGIDSSKISSGVVSNTEFNYLDGVSAAIQTQLNSHTSNFVNFLPLSGGTLTGTLNTLAISATTITASNVILPAQTSATFFAGPSTGVASIPTFRVMLETDLPDNINATKIGTGIINNTEFNRLNNVTSNIQTQFDTLTSNLSATNSNFINFLPTSGGTLSGQLTGPSISAVTISGTSGFYDSTDYRPLASIPAYKEGRFFYDDANKTLTMFNDVSGSSMQVGRESWVRVRNKSGTTILDSEVVYISSAVGQTPTILRAKADLEATSMTLGLASAQILDNAFGEVVTFGLANNLNTSAYADGDMLWLSPTVAGGLTNVKPSAPYYAIHVGIVVHSHATQGKILVHPDTNTHLGYGTGNQLLGMNSTGVSAQYKSVSGIPGMISVDHSANNILLGIEYSSATKDPTGFVNRTDSSLSFTSATRTFTISGTFDVYQYGRRYTKTTESIVITSAAGNHFLYYNSSNVLVDSTSPWSLLTDIPIALVYWTSAGNLILAEERHGCQMDPATHYYLHTTFGTRYVSGFSASYTLTNDTQVGFGLSNGAIADEDITIGITNGTINGAFRQPITSAGSFPVFYRTGVDGVNGGWRKDAATTLPYKNNGGTTLANYNQLSGGSWIQTASTNTTYIAYYIYATDDLNEPVISVQGQRIDTSLSDAQNNNTAASLVTGDFPFVEAKLLYRLILKVANAHTGNNFRVRIEDVFDYRNSLTSIQATAGGTGTVTSVAMTVPSVMTVAGSPIVNAGTLALDFNTQTSGTIFTGPISGSNAIPTFRSLSASDIPSGIDASKIDGGLVSNAEFNYLDGVTSNIQTQFGTINSNFSNFLPTSGGTLTGTLNTLGVSSTNISASSLALTPLTSGQVLYTTTNGVVSSSPKLLYTGTTELRIGSGTTGEQIYLVLNGAAGYNRGIFFQSSATNRWVIGVDGASAETGSDAGSPFRISSYTDAGVFIDQPIVITRAAGGNITLVRPLSSNSTASFTSITASTLTSGRIPYASTAGLLVDSTKFTWDNSGVVLKVGDGTGSAFMGVNGVAGGNRDIFLQTSGTTRWTIRANATPEDGANAGSNLEIISRDNSGNTIDTPISITRVSAGSISSTRSIITTGNVSANDYFITGGNSGQIATIGTVGVIQSDAGLTFAQTASVTTSVVVGNGSSSAEVSLQLNGLASQYRLLKFLTSGTNRWLIGAAPGTESGSNAGSPFQILARTDAGGAIDTPISIVRAAGGAISLVRPLSSTSTASFTSITASGLTSGRVTYATTAGLLTDSAGLTFNGTTSLTVGQSTTGAAVVTLDGASGQWKSVDFATSGVGRWTFACRNIAETGSDAGSPFVIAAKTDAGVIIDYPISILRAANGPITIVRPITMTTSMTVGDLTNTGARYFNLINRSGSASTSTTEHVIRYTSTGGHTETIPAATGSERVLIFKHVGTGIWTIARSASDTIEGATSLSLYTSSSLTLIDSASGLWEIIG